MDALIGLLPALVPIWLALAWLASIRWTQQDAAARLHNRQGIRAATLGAALLPFVGAAVWACVRPGDTLAERRRRRLTRLVLELELGPTPAHVEREPEAADEVEPLVRPEPVSELAA